MVGDERGLRRALASNDSAVGGMKERVELILVVQSRGHAQRVEVVGTTRGLSRGAEDLKKK